MDFKKLQMKKQITIFLFLLIGFKSIAQKSILRLPFKVGNKYAIVNENEKEIVPPLYDDVRILQDFKILLLNKGGLWGIFDFNGKLLLDHVISATGQGYLGAPLIEKVKNGNCQYSKTADTDLLAITDQYANVKYYINPNKTLVKYKPYAFARGENTNLVSTDFSNIRNLFYVLNRDNTCNFIDSTGAEILPQSYEAGEIINENVFVLSQNEKYALFNRNKRLTPFQFEKPFYRNYTSAFIMSKLIPPTNNGRKTLYYVFNPFGAIIDSTTFNPNMMDNYALINRDTGFVLYANDGKILFSHPTYSGNLFKLGSKIYVNSRTQYDTGIMTCEGKEVFSPSCNINFQAEQKMVVTHCDKDFVIRDSLLNPVFSMDSIESLLPTNYPDLFNFGIKKSWRTQYGLINKDKKVLIPAEWNKIILPKCNDFVHLINDSMQVITKLDYKNPILTIPGTWRVYVNCGSNTIETSTGNDSYSIYDFNGKVVKQWDKSEQNDNYSFGPHKYKVSGKNKLVNLVNKEDKKVLSTSFQDILPIKDEMKNESVYICQFADKTHPSTKVYNDALVQITPPGYSVPYVMMQYNKNNPGTLIVVNDADVLKDKYKYRMAICDYNGKWIVPPFLGTIKYFQKGLFILHYYEERKIKVFDNKGNKTCDQDFFMLDKGNGSDFFQNRILVGNIADASYLKKVDALKLENLDMDIAINKLKSLGEPKMSYGYLNKQGKIVLDLKYRKAQPFPMRSIKTFVSVEKDGKLVSQVIDTSGNVYFEADFDEIEDLNDTHYKAKKGQKWAITNLKGETLTPFQFEEIGINRDETFFTAKNEKDYFLINKAYNILSLGHWYNLKPQFLNNYFIVKCMAQEAGSYKTNSVFKIYNENFDELKQIDDAYSISAEFKGSKLPTGYIAVYRDVLSKDGYVYDILNNKKLEK